MKRLLLSALCAMLLSATAAAQSFVGTLNTNGYERKDVTVRIAAKNERQAVLSMYNAKFSRWMPLTVDFDIWPVTVDQNQRLSANNVIPTYKGEKQEKRIVRQLSGAVTGNTLTFKCLMGDKNVSFSGKSKGK
ncbi:MAG: hypothetical protein J6T33_06515 [Bacteroidales bacterium]|nr:hypothetical protein [Bacteroidales bacterium]